MSNRVRVGEACSAPVYDFMAATASEHSIWVAGPLGTPLGIPRVQGALVLPLGQCQVLPL